MPPKDPCQKHACAIQKCLQENKYLESQCEAVIGDMRRCCRIHAAASVCCSGFTQPPTPTPTQTPTQTQTAPDKDHA